VARMTNEFLAFAPISAAPAVDPARALLDEMMARVGVDGLAAAFGDPGLLAQLDQHAAAVRDALAEAGRAVDADGLAAYARSIVAAAVRMGRPVPEPGHAYVSGTAWLSAEWHLMRLVAVCMIAESADLL
jgi:predicted secreted hydrolase